MFVFGGAVIGDFCFTNANLHPPAAGCTIRQQSRRAFCSRSPVTVNREHPWSNYFRVYLGFLEMVDATGRSLAVQHDNLL